MPNEIANNMADTIHFLEEDNASIMKSLTNLQLAYNEQMLELREAKRLLKLSLEQTNPKCRYCIHDLEEEQPNYNPCCTGETANCKWIHADEAEKLLNKIRIEV